MGVSKGVPAFQRKAAKIAVDLQDSDLTRVKAASQIIKKAVERRAPRRLRNVGGKARRAKGGSRIGVRYNVGNFGGDAKSKVFAYGPFQLIERDTKAHRIPRPTVGRGRNKRANTRRILIPGVGWRSAARHPGTKGQRPWRKGVMASYDEVRDVLQSTTVTILKRHF